MKEAELELLLYSPVFGLVSGTMKVFTPECSVCSLCSICCVDRCWLVIKCHHGRHSSDWVKALEIAAFCGHSMLSLLISEALRQRFGGRHKVV